MDTPAFEDTITDDMRRAILDRLAAVERDNGVRIVFAVESGSRAWGFPSPDSDYDVRFVYARPVDWYLSLEPGRDVIECPIDGDLDINGWDVKKALGLLMKPNPVLLEWLSSPIRYIWNDESCEMLTEFAARTSHGPACLRHYLHLGARQWKVYVEGRTTVNLKKYFYILRPAMAIRWVRLNPDSMPPMNFQKLIAGLDLPADLIAEIDDLLVRKSRSKEVGEAARLVGIDAFINREFEWAEEAVRGLSGRGPDLRANADDLFRAIVRAHAVSNAEHPNP